MIDFHTHVLPCVDDGSSDVKESIALLQMLKEQGLDMVIATPHFDPRGDTPKQFLDRRANAYSELTQHLCDKDLPKVFLGAEISYFYGISRVDRLVDLRIVGTKLLLIEMPMCQWSDAMVKELIELATYSDFKPVLAHIERYLGFVPQRLIERLADSGILMQINASFLSSRRTRGVAIRMIKRGYVHFLGSDCHNITSRPPKMSEAIDIIRSKLGNEFFDRAEFIFDKYSV